MSIARDGYNRIIFVQEVTGAVVDIDGLAALNTSTPVVNESTMFFGGTRRVISRNRVLEVPIIRECHVQFLRVMKNQGWPVTCYLFGVGVHDVWAVGELLDVQDARRGAGSFAGAIARLESRVFDGAFGQSFNLVGNIPWACTQSIQTYGVGSGSGSGSGNDFKLLETYRQGYKGPAWDPRGNSASVDITGELTKSGDRDPDLDLFLPCQGATLGLGGLDVSFTLTAFDWSGNILDQATKSGSTDTTLKIPNKTWRLHLAVDSADQIPELTVVNPGRAVEPRMGLYVPPSGVVAGVPEWTS